jgi:hypothetical protein
MARTFLASVARVPGFEDQAFDIIILVDFLRTRNVDKK